MTDKEMHEVANTLATVMLNGPPMYFAEIVREFLALEEWMNDDVTSRREMKSMDDDPPTEEEKDTIRRFNRALLEQVQIERMIRGGHKQPEVVPISVDLWRAQRGIATSVARLRRLKKLDAPAAILRSEEELLQEKITRVADHPENIWEGRDIAEEMG